jgi:hypothetical protein
MRALSADDSENNRMCIASLEKLSFNSYMKLDPITFRSLQIFNEG